MLTPSRRERMPPGADHRLPPEPPGGRALPARQRHRRGDRPGADRMALGQGRGAPRVGADAARASALAILAFGTLLHPALAAAERSTPRWPTCASPSRWTGAGAGTGAHATTRWSRSKRAASPAAPAARWVNAWPPPAWRAAAAPGPARPLHRTRRPGQAAGACAAWTPPASSSRSASASARPGAGGGERLIPTVCTPACKPCDGNSRRNGVILRPLMTNLTDALHIPDTQSERTNATW
jgi:hypothetical protein